MLYDRIIKQGTINEPGGKPDPQFAQPSTVNWMRALRILIHDSGLVRIKYRNTSHRVH